MPEMRVSLMKRVRVLASRGDRGDCQLFCTEISSSCPYSGNGGNANELIGSGESDDQHRRAHVTWFGRSVIVILLITYVHLLRVMVHERNVGDQALRSVL